MDGMGENKVLVGHGLDQGASSWQDGRHVRRRAWTGRVVRMRVLLGEHKQQLWVHKDVKAPFFDELCKRGVVFDSTSPLIATYGSPMIPAREFL